MHTHRLIAKTAKDMAHEAYQALARKSNDFYANHPNEDEYVAQTWTMFVESARTTLAYMLGTNISESLKEEIYEALLRDKSVRYDQAPVPQMRSW